MPSPRGYTQVQVPVAGPGSHPPGPPSLCEGTPGRAQHIRSHVGSRGFWGVDGTFVMFQCSSTSWAQFETSLSHATYMVKHAETVLLHLAQDLKRHGGQKAEEILQQKARKELSPRRNPCKTLGHHRGFSLIEFLR